MVPGLLGIIIIISSARQCLLLQNSLKIDYVSPVTDNNGDNS